MVEKQLKLKVSVLEMYISSVIKSEKWKYSYFYQLEQLLTFKIASYVGNIFRLLAFGLLRKDRRAFCEFSVTYFSKRRNKFDHNWRGFYVGKAFFKNALIRTSCWLVSVVNTDGGKKVLNYLGAESFSWRKLDFKIKQSWKSNSHEPTVDTFLL